MLDIRYLAGLFDGEGCIHIARQELPSGGDGYSYSVRVIYCLTHEPVMRLLGEHFGVKAYRLRKNNPRWKDGFQTQLCGERAAGLLREMMPYLIVKREEATLAVALQDHITRYRRSAKRWSDSERQTIMDYREGLRLQIKSLKRAVAVPAGMVANSENLLCPAGNGAEGQPRAKQASLKLVRAS